MKVFLVHFFKTSGCIALAIVVALIAICLAVLGVLMIFGSFFFERVPDFYLALRHLAIFGGGVLSLSVAGTITIYALAWWA